MGTTIIAEVGVNHNGNIDIAKKLIEVAAQAKCDYVKFQTFDASKLSTNLADKANYQKKAVKEVDETQIQMLSKLSLSASDETVLKSHCDKFNIKFLSTAFDVENLNRLIELGMDFIKVPSGEITNLPYLRHVAQKGLPVLLSTGMSTYAEVEAALKVLLTSGINRRDITILQCTSSYPAQVSSANLRVLETFREKLDVKVGYSDHTIGIATAIAAVAMGAQVIEKHITLDKSMAGPDHASSIEPPELQKLVVSIREVELALGDGCKIPQEDELENIYPIRRSIVASRGILKGEILSEGNMTAKRPQGGLSPMLWDSVVGKIAHRDYSSDEFIEIRVE